MDALGTRLQVFGAEFYANVLPTRVRTECGVRPETVPVVQLYLSNGRVLDLCHIVHLADDWMACRVLRDSENCDDMDLVFIPYGLVAMVTVSLHHAAQRRIGFDAGASEDPAAAGQKNAGAINRAASAGRGPS